ncbi:SDR family NAD(P)-dependent oxidoreductase [Candidatus Viridilinea mediisalina]|uniref:Short-chain dehydrogenase n=1 Tax=Candidatus Viridilinea mediisalina TaxID=2024553 RepID=A0A2A6RJ55_9CHLR|nr:SDR family NAD(P)-dependent oxidoreductase [Candidatus Viridilinea mediisalina]PDW02888.1 short-chain dehydrogenase [Candidatus Viridilinea mediisalina]
MLRKTMTLEGQVAVITGSSRGIGRAIAERFGAAGARVVVSSSQPQAVETTVQALLARGVVATGISCDVGERTQVEALMAYALDSFKQVDIWVNNAGISGTFGCAIDVPPDEWEQVIRTNLLGTYYGSRTVLPYMLKRGYGKLINVTGGGYRRAQRYLGAYSASKAGIVRLSEALAREHAEIKGVSINVLAPGIVPTDMTKELVGIGPAAQVLWAFPKIMQVFGTTSAETAELALYMASAATNGVSGKIFEVMPRHRSLWRVARSVFRRDRL